MTRGRIGFLRATGVLLVWGAAILAALASECGKKDPIEPRKEDTLAWRAVDHGATTQLLRDIYVDATGQVFAAGNQGAIIRYDGAAWAQMSSRTIEGLYSIWGTSVTDVWAGGTAGALVHFDGTSWTPQGAFNTLIVEVHGNGLQLFLLARLNNGTGFRYDNPAWTNLGSGGADFPVNAMWVSPSGGFFTAGGGGQIMEWDPAKGFSSFSTSTGISFHGIWGASNADVFAVGDGGLILHYDGNSDGVWMTMAQNSLGVLRDIWGTSGKDVFVVGDKGTIVHYDGQGWTKITEITASDLYGVWGSASDNVYVCGAGGTILRFSRL